MLEKEEAKAAAKEALKEWLDDKFLAFGKWTFAGLLAGLFFASIYFMLSMSGWHFTDQLGVNR